jgi:biopolymer transport protein ExbD
MRSGRSSYFDAQKPRVEVIPMIDIMMFLLVFFVIVAVRMIAGTGVAMELPGSTTTQELKSSTITVGVTKSGETVIDGKPVSGEELKQRLRELKRDKPIDVVIAGDKDASLQTLLGVMDSVRGAGITSVGWRPRRKNLARHDSRGARPAVGRAEEDDAQGLPLWKALLIAAALELALPVLLFGVDWSFLGWSEPPPRR